MVRHRSGPSGISCGGSSSVRQTFARPASRPPGTAAPRSRAPAPRPVGGDVPAAPRRRGQAGCRPCRARPTPRSPAPGVPRWVPGLLAALGVGCTLVAIAVGAPGRRRPRRSTPATPPSACSTRWSPPWCSAGSRATGSAGCSWSASSPARTCWPAEYVVARRRPPTGSCLDLAAWLAAWGFVPYYVIVALVPLYFPDGTLPSPRWRPIARVLATVVVVGTRRRDAPERPARLRARVREPPGRRALWINVVLLALLLHRLPGRRRRSASPRQLVRMRRAERRRAHPAAVAAAGRVGAVRLHHRLAGPRPAGRSPARCSRSGSPRCPLAVAVAVLRHGLFDVGQVISRAVVFSVLSGAAAHRLRRASSALLGELSAGERRFAVALTGARRARRRGRLGARPAGGRPAALRRAARPVRRRHPARDDARLRRRPRRGAAGAGRRGRPGAAAAARRDRARRSAAALGPLGRRRPAGRRRRRVAR